MHHKIVTKYFELCQLAHDQVKMLINNFVDFHLVLLLV